MTRRQLATVSSRDDAPTIWGVRSMARMENVADALAEGHVLRGDAGALNRSISDAQRGSVADVQRVIERYLDPERAAILHYVPAEVGA